MIHFGYYYHLPELYSMSTALILGFIDDKFRFFGTDYRNVPSKYFRRTSGYNGLYDPVMFSCTGEEINDIIFLNDIPLVESENANPGNVSYILSNSLVDESYVFNNGTKCFLTEYSEREKKFIGLFIKSVIMGRKIKQLTEESSYIKATDYKFNNKYLHVVKKYKDYINSFDLPSLLSSLSVSVTDHLRTKIGDDDTYYIYRHASLKDGTVVEDSYLRELIGLGKVCIYKDSGYTNNLEYYAKDFIKEHPLGVYEGELLEHEKERIIRAYSKEEHMGRLFYQQLYEQYKAENQLNEWRKKKEVVDKSLSDDFYTGRLSCMDKRFLDHGTPNRIAKLNRYINQLQSNLPEYKVVFSGEIPAENSKVIYAALKAKMIDLLYSKNLIIITGNARGVEEYSFAYALENFIPLHDNYTGWTMLGREYKIERAREMCEIADHIILTDTPESIIYKNFQTAANELGKTIEYLK